MYKYIIRYRYPGFKKYHCVRGGSRYDVLTKFNDLRIKPHTLAEIYIVLSWPLGARFLSNREFDKYLVN